MPVLRTSRPLGAHRAHPTAALLVACAAVLACGGGGDAPTPPTPPPTGGPPASPLRVSPAADSLVAVNATTQLVVVGAAGAAPAVVWRSADTTVAVVSQSGRVRALGDGSTTVTARAADGTSASARIVVRQQVVGVTVTPATALRPLGRTQRFVATPVDANGVVVPELIAAWTTPSADRVTVDAAGLATGRAFGADTVRATIAGVVGVAVLTVDRAPTPHFTPDTIVVGAGQRIVESPTQPPFLMLDTIAEGEGADLTIASSDVEVATVAVGTGTWSGATRRHALTITGRRAGTTLLTSDATGFLPAQAVVRVTTPHVLAGTYPRGSTLRVGTRLPYGTSASVSASVGDSTGAVHPSVAGVTLTARSTDPAVIEVVTATAAVSPGGTGGSFPLRPVAAGYARIVLEAPGHRPDTVRVEVVADGPRFVFDAGDQDRVATIGVGLRDEVGILFARPPADDPDAVITLRQRRPDLLRIPSSVSRATSIWHEAFIALEGLAPGVDTIVAELPGYPSDTQIVHVTRPRLVASGTPHRLEPIGARRTTIDEATGYHVMPTDSTGRPALLALPRVRLRVTSTDPTVLQPRSASASLDPSGAQYDAATLPVQLVGLGTAALRVEDEAGLFAPYVTPTITVEPLRLAMGVRSERARRVTLGMGQSIGGDGMWAEMLNGQRGLATVRLRSTDPRIVRPVTDSAAGTLRAHFDVVAGDVTGSAWIVASGTGMVADSILVEVGRPSFRIDRHGSTTDLPGAITVRLLDQAGNVRSVAEPFEIALDTSDPTVMGFARPTVTFAPGKFESDLVSPIALKVGAALLIVRDSRTPARYDPEATTPLAMRP